MDTFFEQLAGKVSEEKEFIDNLSDLRRKKLWHQFGLELQSINGKVSLSPHLQSLQETVINHVKSNLNPTHYAVISVAVARTQTDLCERVKFLENVADDVKGDAPAKLHCDMERVRALVKQGELKAAKELLKAGRKSLDDYVGIMAHDSQSALYLATLEYHQVAGPPSDFFENSLLYLTYTPLPSIPLPEQQALASAVTLAAVCGENIYSFGELLQHPVTMKLHGTPAQWQVDLLIAFNKGDITSFKTIYAAHNNELSSHEAFLNQKIRIMALVDLVFTRSSHARTLQFSEIAAACDLEVGRVEYLLMKSFSLKVLKGEIDQVYQLTRIKWVQPRVLDPKQLTHIQTRMSAWVEQVASAATYVESNAPELLSTA